MYAIKIMSAENKADSDVGKGYKIILVDAGDTFEFGHNDLGEPIVSLWSNRDGEPTYGEVVLTGNTYVLSHTGKTIASFWGVKKPVYNTLPVVEMDGDQSLGKDDQAGKLIYAQDEATRAFHLKDPEVGVQQEWLRWNEDVYVLDDKGVPVIINDAQHNPRRIIKHRKGDVVLDKQGDPVLKVGGPI